jgi:hypothetical protein
MNQDQLLGLLRNLISVGGGYAIGRGWLNGEQVTLLGGLVGTLVPLLWTVFVHTDSAKIAAASALPDVAKIIVAPTAPTDSAAAVAARDSSQPKVSTAPVPPASAASGISGYGAKVS